MIAVDTNVLVYRLDRTEPEKQAVAKQLLSRLVSEGETVLLWQVAGELVNQLTVWQHKKLLKQPAIQHVIHQFETSSLWSCHRQSASTRL